MKSSASATETFALVSIRPRSSSVSSAEAAPRARVSNEDCEEFVSSISLSSVCSVRTSSTRPVSLSSLRRPKTSALAAPNDAGATLPFASGCAA
jgi:hypothetical protein